MRLNTATNYSFTDPVSGDTWVPPDLNLNGASQTGESFYVWKNGPIAWSSSFASDARAAVIYVPVVTANADSSREFILTAYQTIMGVPVAKSYKYTVWITPDVGKTWTEIGSSNSASALEASVDDILYNYMQSKSNGGPTAVTEGWLVFALEPPAGSTSGLPEWDTLTLATNRSSTNFDYMGCDILIIYFIDLSSNYINTQIPNFSLKVVAHESFQGQSDALVYVNQSTPSYGLTVGDAAADVGITRSSFVAGNEVELNLIDLRYSLSTPGTEITIDAQAQDNSESIQDWRNIVGSYTLSLIHI